MAKPLPAEPESGAKKAGQKGRRESARCAEREGGPTAYVPYVGAIVALPFDASLSVHVAEEEVVVTFTRIDTAVVPSPGAPARR